MGRPFDVPEPVPLAEQSGQTFSALVLMMQRLLAADGCPWDREQTPESLKRYVLEEACEVIDAIDSGDREALADELGDLALQVVFLSELGRAEGAFGPDDVMRAVLTKLVRRHPHVFGDGAALTATDVERSWNAIKKAEKARRPLLDSIPRSLPALLAAQRISDRVAEVGFDFPDRAGAADKVREEFAELEEAVAAGSKAEIEHELGDALLALVNFARHSGLDAEAALAGANARFRSRFAHVEARVRAEQGGFPEREGKPTTGIPLQVLEDYWQEAKRLES